MHSLLKCPKCRSSAVVPVNDLTAGVSKKYLECHSCKYRHRVNSKSFNVGSEAVIEEPSGVRIILREPDDQKYAHDFNHEIFIEHERMQRLMPLLNKIYVFR